MQLAVRWALLPQDKHGKKIGVAALEIRSMVAPGYIRNHLDIRKLLGARPEAAPLQRKVRKDAGVPRKLTPEVQAKLAASPSPTRSDSCKRRPAASAIACRARQVRVFGLPLCLLKS